jgi:hypothetical protein
MAWGKKTGRPGWVQAPPLIELEIRGVWQEDELPDEITQSPAHHAFTLGSESQDWVDSMEEIVDGGDAVYGRSKTVSPRAHPLLATPPPPAPQASPARAGPTYVWPSAQGPDQRRAPPARPRVLMPDIDAGAAPVKPPPAPRAPRDLMPDIDTGPAAVNPSPPTRAPRDLMPDIDAGAAPNPARSSSGPRTAMPDIGGESAPVPRARTLPRRVLVPDIGGEEKPSQTQASGPGPNMPDIGADEKQEEAENRPKGSMPDIG